ncbi:MAG TPA: endonuclease/exonuclease/phosphatase family protein [Burkholderiaceae bacterium]|jgi:endonuclease/exonuclease/phosphatase family metal-dependent hydrolase|nr:endonuclease/exonuclease/phosphatase family protein [Burkholderiaceae bacterium]
MSRPSLRVLSLNAHKGFTPLNRRFILQELREAVRTVAADLVFLQEVVGVHSRHARRHKNWPAVPQYEYLADTLWTDHAYGRNAVYPHGDHGNALLSRYPIRFHRNHDASLGSGESRGFLHCVLELPGGMLHAICVHLGLRERDRRQQLDLLCGLIEREVPPDAPLIVAGDFNDWRRRAHDRLQHCAGLHEVFVTATGQPARTFPARWPLLALDRIYVRHARISHPLVLGARPWSHLSDHAPLAAELHW